MSETDAFLIQLIVSFQSAAMLQMGKIMNPLSGKVERDLDQAKQTIEMLAMLERKTTGNLSDDEKRLLDHVLYELRMNYVDESARPAEDLQEKTDDSASQGTDAPAAESEPPDSAESNN